MNVRILSTSALVLLVAAFSLTAVSEEQDNSKTTEAKVGELLIQKRDVLKARFEIVAQRHKDGTVDFEKLANVQEALLQAELEIAPTKEAKLKLIKQRISNRRTIEERIKNQMEIGTRSVDDLHLATAERLQAEIDYLREESKTE